MSLKGSRLFLGGGVLLLLLTPAPTVLAQPVTDAAVAARIALLRERLIQLQNADGSWNFTAYPVGATALAVLALRTAGVPTEARSIQRAVRYLVENTDGKVYSEGLIPCALELVGPEKHWKRLQQAVKFLVRSQRTNGAWSYVIPAAPGAAGDQPNAGFLEQLVAAAAGFDNSNTQFAVLGLGAADRCGAIFPDATRQRAITYWRDSQRGGGWGYRDTDAAYPTMTCAGIASLHLLGVSLETPGERCGEYRYDATLAAAMACLGRQLSGGLGRFSGQHLYYGLYALERVGMLLEFKRIGNVDWYRAGAGILLSKPLGNRVPDLAFSLLFLAKGSAPIAIAKWQWNGDWNNDHQDVRNWVSRAGTLIGRPLDWVPARLDRLDSPAAKASLIFVNGHGAFQVTEAELVFLRAFLDAGGTVVAEGCCGSRVFMDSFRREIRDRLYPGTDLAFVPIDSRHPVCSSHHSLDPLEVGGLVLRAGCRKRRVLLLGRDASCALNREAVLPVEQKRAFQVAENLLLWALQDRAAERKLDRVVLTPGPTGPESLTVDQLRRRAAGTSRRFRQPFGRLRHNGDWLTDPRFFEALRVRMRGRSEFPRFDGEVYVRATSDDLFQVAVLFMTGHEDPALTAEERLALRTYLENGGFLLISACCSSPGFDAGARALLAGMLPNDTLEPIPATDTIWQRPFPCRSVPADGTAAYRAQHGTAWADLLGVRREGRWIVVYSPVDFCCALEDDLDEDVIGYRPDSALCLAANCLTQALSP